MRPFFPYYGSKWRIAHLYGPPGGRPVVEAFAGSAGYSVRHAAPVARLYDRSADVCLGWDWLIRCSDADVARIPDVIRSNEEYRALPDGARQVVGLLVGFAQDRVPKSLKSWYLEWARTGIPTRTMERSRGGRWWGPAMKARILAQKPLVADWTVDCLDYRDIPDMDAFWFVDPPYSGPKGRRYPHSDVDYADLAEWCRSRSGPVVACEAEGADWLPFEPLCAAATACPSRKSMEMVWRKGPCAEPAAALGSPRAVSGARESRCNGILEIPAHPVGA